MSSLSAPRWRVAVLVALGAWIVHQLRYALVAGDHAAHSHEHAHDYLTVVGPLLVWAVAIASASWVISLGRTDPRQQARGGAAPSRCGIWMRASAALIAIYSLQETLEGLLVPGHSNVLLGVFGHGGWIALPLSIAVAGAIALALRTARAAREAVARARRVALTVLVAQPPVAVAPRIELARASHVLATKLAGRAPPRTV